MRTRLRFAVALVLAVLASASTWFYVNRILRAQQIADAAAHNRPRGNLSDLYPRWLGARELLRHGRNPYSAEITREIQQGYYGRPLDPGRAGDPKDQQRFAYPAYVVFLLSPSVDLPFDAVETGLRWLLVLLAPATVLLWLYVLRWKPPVEVALIFSILMLGWLPMVQGIKLQQLSLVVAGLLAASGACLAGGWLMLLWAGSQWRSRWRFLFGFGFVMLLLMGGAELVLPGWLQMFAEAIRQYHEYTQNQSLLVWLFGSIVGRVLEALSVLLCAICVWRVRRAAATTTVFGQAFALMLALTVVIVPMSAPYNQVLLAPAILALLRSESSEEAILPSVRRVRQVGALLLAWPWIATVGLSLGYPWLTPGVRGRIWLMPFYSNFMVPVFVFGLMTLQTSMIEPHGLRDSATAE